MSNSWYTVNEADQIPSPSLLVYPDRIQANIRQMLATVKGPQWLRPHIKTHKMAEVIRLQMKAGIRKFKCATLTEAELLLRCGAEDVLVAMQLTGPGPRRFLQLQRKYPDSQLATLFDCEATLDAFAKALQDGEDQVCLYLDLNIGMDRTGIVPGKEAASLYAKASERSQFRLGGLHAYDGHHRQEDLQERKKACDRGFEAVMHLKETLENSGHEVPTLVAGGSPTFPVHAKREGVECSPGTTLLWDWRYQTSFPDMKYQIAAVLFSRVVSKPGPELFCLDLGHKAVAPEMPFPRVALPDHLGSEQESQSEEHLVVRHHHQPSVGEAVYAFPVHICPTVAKYPEVLVIQEGKLRETWRIAARDHSWQEAAAGL